MGDCADGYLCVGVAGTGNHCYRKLNGSCGSDFPSGGAICLQNCNPASVSPGCPSKTQCVANGESGDDSGTVGYCVGT